jgi:ribonuclease HII
MRQGRAAREAPFARGKLGILRDSKKLSAKQRELWFEYFENNSTVYWSVARVNPKTIDSINISRAANRAAIAALKKLLALYAPRLPLRDIYLDGSLYLGTKERSIEEFSASTIIKGDEKIPAISAASIMAKVTRDRLMVRLAGNYPGYGLEIHKGYGTKRHYEALREHGPSEAHRKTFLKKFG